MSRLLLTNNPASRMDEIRASLDKYGLPPSDAIEQVPGDGTRPSVVLEFKST